MSAPEFRYPRKHRYAVPARNDRSLETWLRTYAVRYNDDLEAQVDKSLRLVPQAQNPSASDGPDAYPAGYSLNQLSSSTGWPIATGWVETFHDPSIARARQVLRQSTAGATYERYRASSTTWSNWRLLHGVDVLYQNEVQYNVVAASTWETAKTQTISTFPTSNFSAQVSAVATCWSRNTTAAATNIIRLGISRDGGSTWNDGIQQNSRADSTSDYVPHTAVHTIGGGVTGTIQVRIEVYSGHADTFYDDFNIMTRVGPDW